MCVGYFYGFIHRRRPHYLASLGYILVYCFSIAFDFQLIELSMQTTTPQITEFIIFFSRFAEANGYFAKGIEDAFRLCT